MRTAFGKDSIVGLIGLIGATGAAGRAIAEELHAQGRPYRAIARSRERLDALFGSDPLAERAVWDPADPASVRAALDGVESAVYLVGVDYWAFDQHPVLMQAALDGAIAAGVKRMLLYGTVYPYGAPQSTPVSEAHPREPHTFKGRMRARAEQVLMDADARGAIRGAVLRIPDLYGPGMEKSFLSSAFANAPLGKTAQVLGPIDTPHQFAYIPDTAKIVTALVESDAAYGTHWNYAGSGVITQREFVAKIYAACGTTPKLMVANLWMLRLMGLFDRLMRELIEMHYLQTTPVILDDAKLTALLGALPRTSYDEGIRRTLESEKTKSRA